MAKRKTKIYKFKRHMQHYWQLNIINECKWTRTVVFVKYFRSLLYIRCISSINMTIPMYIYYESQSFIFFFVFSVVIWKGSSHFNQYQVIFTSWEMRTKTNTVHWIMNSQRSTIQTKKRHFPYKSFPFHFYNKLR